MVQGLSTYEYILKNEKIFNIIIYLLFFLPEMV